MKKIGFFISIILLTHSLKSKACGGDYYDYGYYSTLFSQELINDPLYTPFLWAPFDAYYGGEWSQESGENKGSSTKNGNIEEWQKYLGISYDDAYYLVFKASLENVTKLISGKNTGDKKLDFANKQFIITHRDALQYLQIAKEVEPFMIITGSGDNSWYDYGDDSNSDIDGLDYNENCLKLQKAWKVAKSNELKLRYGYQLVRLAHYKRRYSDAVQFFDKYVEPLNFKPEMYYYALSQYAGALRGEGNILESNENFFKVFANSTDLKKMAYTSMRFNENIDFERFMAVAKTVDEKNNADLLLGYISFSNPLNSAQKIIDRSPDAVQAKVLAARALTQVENDIKTYGDFSGYSDKRLPIIEKDRTRNFKEVLTFVTKQANFEKMKNRNFWNMASAYMHYLDKNFDVAQRYLNGIDVKEAGYKKQRDILAMLVDIGQERVINDEVERRIFNEYADIFNRANADGRASASGFVIDILANRYFLQKDYAKSFMLQSSLDDLNSYPRLDLLDEIERVYNKPNKNPFESFLTLTFSSGVEENKKSVPVQDYINYMRGILYLTANNTDKALEFFTKSAYSSFDISSDVFGYNSVECFTCDDNMKTDYLSEFPYIKSEMNVRILVTVLQKLKAEANENNPKAAKANYLLGNFFYNVSVTGYYRNYLRFWNTGSYLFSDLFCPNDRDKLFKEQVSMKFIPTFFDNPVNIAESYLNKAYKMASGNEFKARIVFALSKCEQENYYQSLVNKYCGRDRWDSYYEDWVMISDRENFRELMKYKNTTFFKQVQSNCKYFDYYVSNVN